MANVVAARKGHPLRATRSLSALRDADWLVLDPLDDAGTPFGQIFSQHGLALPERVTECSFMSLALSMCLRMDTLILLSAESLTSRYLRDTMDFFDIDERMPERMISLVTRERHTLAGSAARLHDALGDALRDYDPLKRAPLEP